MGERAEWGETYPYPPFVRFHGVLTMVLCVGYTRGEQPETRKEELEQNTSAQQR